MRGCGFLEDLMKVSIKTPCRVSASSSINRVNVFVSICSGQGGGVMNPQQPQARKSLESQYRLTFREKVPTIRRVLPTEIFKRLATRKTMQLN